MRKIVILLVVVMLVSLIGISGEYLTNDTGGTVFGLRIVFAEPVKITGFGDVLLSVDPQGESIEFTFSGGELEAWGGHWMNWEPSGVPISSHEWIVGGAEAEDQPAVPIDPLSSTPNVYLYVPKISYTLQEHRCLDCKTFAIVAVMSYYGIDVPFIDICREVGEPPGATFEGVDFFRRLIQFVESKGFLVEPHYWTVDRILEEVEAGRPVIASHLFVDSLEPGIVKGFTDTHLWVWGSSEYIQQRSKDSVYTHAEFQALLEKRNSGTGLMGYVPYLFDGPVNCFVVYKPGINVIVPSYEIEVVSHSTRSQSSAEGRPGVVRVMSFAGDGEMRWSEQLRVGEDVQIEVLVYNSEYVVTSEEGPTVIFGVRFLPGSREAGNVIQGCSSTEKSIWRSPLGHIFEEVSLPVTRLSNAWVGRVVISPVSTLEQLIVKWPVDIENKPFFGYEIRVEE